MKAIVKMPYFDDKGLHKRNEVVEVATLNPYLEVITETTEKKTVKKTGKKKEV